MARILIVDDERVTVELLSMALSLRGHTPLVAYHAKQGLEMVASESPDVVLLDLMMPGMDGYELLARIRAMPEGKDIIVIVLSASHGEDLERHILEKGGDAYFKKPIDIKVVERTIREFMHHV